MNSLWTNLSSQKNTTNITLMFDWHMQFFLPGRSFPTQYNDCISIQHHSHKAEYDHLLYCLNKNLLTNSSLLLTILFLPTLVNKCSKNFSKNMLNFPVKIWHYPIWCSLSQQHLGQTMVFTMVQAVLMLMWKVIQVYSFITPKVIQKVFIETKMLCLI